MCEHSCSLIQSCQTRARHHSIALSMRRVSLGWFFSRGHKLLKHTKDKLEDMDVSLGMSASLSGPTLQTWITQKWLNISNSFFMYMKIWDICGYLQLVSCIFIKQSSNESILKNMFMFLRSLTRHGDTFIYSKLGFSEIIAIVYLILISYIHPIFKVKLF